MTALTYQFQFAVLAIAASWCAAVAGQAVRQEVTQEATQEVAQERPVAPAWVEQYARTADHTFLVKVARYDDLHAPKAIQVIDRKTGVLLQEIADETGIEMARDPARFIGLVDANVDGYPDIVLAVNNGGAGPNSMDNFYLFDPRLRRYALHEGLSELPQVRIDGKGIITSAARGSCCHHYNETYRFIGAKMMPVTSREEVISLDGKWLRITTGTFRRGKMHYKVKRVPAPPGY